MAFHRNIAIQQLGAYLIVGGLSSVIDVGLFWLIAPHAASPIAASAASFTVATLANYFLSYAIAFVRGRYSRAGEIVRIVVISVVGLAVNTLAMWAGVYLGLPPLVAKIIAIPVVLIWNFMGRRLFVFERDRPPPILDLAKRSHRSVSPPVSPSSGPRSAARGEQGAE
ncbi:MAG: GtrA family protein [Caulobacteraceae bacterium]